VELDAQADALTSAGAALVGLQEVDCEFGPLFLPRRQRTSLLNMPRLLAARLNMNYVFGSAQDDIRYPSDNAGYVEWGAPDKWTNNGQPHGEVGNALLTSLDLLTTPTNLALPRREGKERRACIRAELRLPNGGAAVVYAAHLQHDSAESRSEQMSAILDAAAKDAECLVFIMGDLNHDFVQRKYDASPTADPLTQAISRGFSDLHDEYARSRGLPCEGTFPSDKPDRRIDYILANRPLQVLAASTIQTTASDHLPLVVEVELPHVNSSAAK